ncbi:Eco57I restriction-modification methylase domain-containing protein [Sinorhizobium meliloti]
MDKATRNAIERATQQARKLLDDDFSAQLEGTFDVLRSGVVAPEGGAHLSARQQFERGKIVAAIEHKRAAGTIAAEAVTEYVRDAAFTTLNRFVALKMLEARQLVQECITRGEQSAGFKEFCGLAPGLALLPDAAGYRLYIESLFDEFSTEIKVLFDRRDAASVLWPKRQTFEALLTVLNAPDLSTVWGEDETIGWVYQFFNSGEERRKMRDESQAPRNSRELAVRNQFFTPRYVVEFLVDNTLGRMWMEMHGEDTALVNTCEYLVRADEEADQPRPRKDPRDLRVLDPACGSGHFLLYSFDLLLAIYEEAWAAAEGTAPTSEATGRSVKEDYPDLADLRRAAPGLIVEHNLHGVDIDARCAQIAALALWLRAQRAWKELGIGAADRPRITRTHIVVAEPMPGDASLVTEFADRLDPPLLRGLFKKMVSESHLAGELGTLLRVDDGIAAELKSAREQFVSLRNKPAFLPGMEPEQKQGSLDLSGIDDDRFFHEAEARIVEALRLFAETAPSAASLRRRLFSGDAAQGIALIDLVRTHFDVVLMNPPFGACSLPAKANFEKSYPRTKNDVYAAFVERGVALLRPRGMLGAITSRTGFFLSSFQKWREEILLKTAPPVVFADLGYGVLDGAMVEVAAYCLEKVPEVSA